MTDIKTLLEQATPGPLILFDDEGHVELWSEDGEYFFADCRSIDQPNAFHGRFIDTVNATVARRAVNALPATLALLDAVKRDRHDKDNAVFAAYSLLYDALNGETA